MLRILTSFFAVPVYHAEEEDEAGAGDVSAATQVRYTESICHVLYPIYEDAAFTMSSA